jgi:hypothetical protein
MKVTFNTRAALRGEIIPAWLVFPAALGEAAELPPMAEPMVAESPAMVEPFAAEPPMTGAEPLLLLSQVRFEGLLLVTYSDMIVVGGMN